jgi:hypothetical protein
MLLFLSNQISPSLGRQLLLFHSVLCHFVDPDPSLDPYVYGPPDPDPSLFCIDPDPDRSTNKQKKIKKNLDFYLFYFLSVKTDVYVPSKSNTKKIKNKLF